MEGLQNVPTSTRSNGRSHPESSGARLIRPVDRSHLLRRSSRHPIASSDDDETDGIRLRRKRRVNAPFVAIPALSRTNGH